MLPLPIRNLLRQKLKNYKIPLVTYHTRGREMSLCASRGFWQSELMGSQSLKQKGRLIHREGWSVISWRTYRHHRGGRTLTKG